MGGLDESDFLTEEEAIAARKRSAKAIEDGKRWVARVEAMRALRAKYGAGSQYRFHKRLWQWRDSGVSWPTTKHAFWWLVHNSLAHIGIAVLPIRWTFAFHDYTSRKLNITPPIDER